MKKLALIGLLILFTVAKVQKKYPNFPSPDVRSIIYHSTDKKKILLATTTHGIVRSSDGGKIRDVNVSLPYPWITHLLKANNNLIIATWGNGVISKLIN